MKRADPAAVRELVQRYRDVGVRGRGGGGTRRFWERSARIDPGEDARAIDGSDAEPVAALLRRSRAASGDGRRSISRAARSASAISCRTCSRSCSSPRRSCCASSCFARRVAAVRRGRRAALVARAGRPGRAHAASRTIGCGWSSPHCTTSRRPATQRCSDEEVPFLEGRLLNPDEHEAYERPTSLEPDARSLYEHCVRADRDQHADRRARPAADGDRRLERRHEPASAPSGRGEERVARLVPGVDASNSFAPPSPRARGERPIARRSTAATPRRCVTAIEEAWDGDWYRRAYFDDGTPLGSSARAGNAGSTRSRSRGRSICRRAAIPSARAARSRSVERLLVQRDDRLRPCC